MELGLSGVLAVDFMIQLVRNELKGQYPYPELKKPNWGNFTFFSKIKARKMERITHVPRQGNDVVSFWKVEQQFEFWSRRRIVAVVTMAGEVWDRSNPEMADYSRSERSMWRVAKVCYAQSYWSRHDECVPSDWIEATVPDTGMTGGQV